MYNQLITALAGLACVAALLVGGSFASAAQGTAATVPTAPESVQEAAREVVEDAASQPRKRARARASLSMPYFSFARSMRPRG